MSHFSLKTRFCPSPTGLMHLGNLRTALFNALYARGQQGTFLLRIEDTDRERSEDQFTQAIKTDLTWLGLNWNEGPDRGGDHAPYHQSQRQSIYDRYYNDLENLDLAYPCFCSEQQLAISRKLQRAAGKPPRYAGTCASFTFNEVNEKIEQWLKPTLRFRVAKNQAIEFDDLVKGRQSFQTNDIGDFIVRRTDGTSPFMYCNALDDALMGVTHVLRGEDHVTNTPRQIMILRALQLPIPTYGHISLIVGADGAPLSKRHGSRSIQALRELGYLPDAIINYLARLGHNYTDEHYMSLSELAEKFSITHLGKAPARFDNDQLQRWQREAMSRVPLDKLWEMMGRVHPIVKAEDREMFVEAVRPNITFVDEAENWAKCLFADKLDFSDESEQVLKDAGGAILPSCCRIDELR